MFLTCTGFLRSRGLRPVLGKTSHWHHGKIMPTERKMKILKNSEPQGYLPSNELICSGKFIYHDWNKANNKNWLFWSCCNGYANSLPCTPLPNSSEHVERDASVNLDGISLCMINVFSSIDLLRNIATYLGPPPEETNNRL